MHIRYHIHYLILSIIYANQAIKRIVLKSGSYDWRAKISILILFKKLITYNFLNIHNCY
jgi:hypothetical protein